MMQPERCWRSTGAASLAQRKLLSRFNRHAAPPVFERHVFEQSRRAGNTGVVDQHVQAAQVRQSGGEHGRHRSLVGHVASHTSHRRVVVQGRRELARIDVTDKHLRAGLRKGPCCRQANAAYQKP